MSISNTTLTYLKDALTLDAAGIELSNAITTSATLSADTANRLKTAMSEDIVAKHVQAAILGTRLLSKRDKEFMKCGFSSQDVVNDIVANLVVGSPSFSPAPVSVGFGPTQSVSLSSITPGAKIYYTTNGTTPTTASTLFTTPISVASTETIKALAVTTGVHNSPVTSALYTINGAVATPTFSPVAGSYSGTQTVTVSSATSGSTFYYTADGSTPTTASTLYVGPISVAVSKTIKVLGTKAGFSNSAIASAAYVIS